ncbi:MAG TPA: alanine racemase [Bryobacteraceae bacterium]|nr:alanine racemase [Bryobacteraceae bacterium]
MPHNMIGHPVQDLDTPAIVIDLDILERNLENVASYAKEHGLRLRPHTKTHKIPALGRKQVELGAAGLTVAKVSEAEVMATIDPPSILIAYPIIGHPKLERLMALARSQAVTVALDSFEVAQGLSDAAAAAGVSIGILAEFDGGLHRVGVQPERLISLIERIHDLPGLRFEGIAFYPGHIKKLDDEGDAKIREASALLRDVLSRVRERWPVEVVSGGSTPALYRSHEFDGINEIRPGTYIFNDWNTVLSGGCEFADCAARIHATVVSTSVPGQIVLDGGSKTFSSDRPAAAADALFGQIVDHPEAEFFRLNEEHGWVRVPDNGKFKIGQRLEVIPVHVCVAINLHDQVYGVRNGCVEVVWKVEGRGKLQ